ncbi:hypothetical protein QTP70_006706 [Hemibagrus guttatus]|uniref:Uncharacterized protein n=1 Tax=Hemibagrus guttatus TaxID=175788 RepID=A0AAE0Q7U4_9TELE|nr:hypothetical protein QTP70_006706 [Hemibagrus guttatus]
MLQKSAGAEQRPVQQQQKKKIPLSKFYLRENKYQSNQGRSEKARERGREGRRERYAIDDKQPASSISIISTTLAAYRSDLFRSTPLYSAPLHSSPLRSILLRSTPLYSAPVHSTPLYSAPVHSALFCSSPLRSILLQSTPLRSILLQSTPLRSILLQSTPLRSILLQSTPLRSILLQSTPLYSALLRSALFCSNPLYSAPVHSTLLYSAPVHSTPLNSAAVHSTPLNSATVHSTPLYSAPIQSILPQSRTLALEHFPLMERIITLCLNLAATGTEGNLLTRTPDLVNLNVCMKRTETEESAALNRAAQDGERMFANYWLPIMRTDAVDLMPKSTMTAFNFHQAK